MIDKNTGCFHTVGRNDADRYDCMRFSNDGPARERHDRIEIVRGQRILKIADIVSLMCREQGKVRVNRFFQQKVLPLDGDDLLAFLDQRAAARRCEDAAKAAAGRPDPLHKCSLRDQVDVDVTGNHFLLCFRIEPNMGGNDPGNGTCRHQLSDATPGHGRIVCDDRQVFRSSCDDGIYEPVRGADPHEPADQHSRSVRNELGGLSRLDGLFH